MDTTKTRDIQEAFIKTEELKDFLKIPYNFMLYPDDDGKYWFIPLFGNNGSRKVH